MADCKVFTVRLDPQNARRVEFIARVEGLAVNDVFRHAIEGYVDTKRGEPGFMERVAAILAEDAAIADQLRHVTR
jgi:predicted transcriptional regulator